MAELASLVIGDEAALWRDLGFDVADGTVAVSGVALELGGAAKGIRGWSVRGVDAGSIDGLPLEPARPEPPPPAVHPNGVVGLDHVVLLTPDLDRTIGALASAGIELRRTRDSTTYRTPMKQAFFRLGPVVLEVVGPLDGPSGDGPPRFYGLAFTVSDLDATAAHLGARLRPAKDAVQPGRRIATLDRAAGSTVALAFMTPEPARSTA